MDYQEYLRSEHWQDVRKRFYASKLGKSCFVCGTHTGLQVHHKSYKRLGKERLTDLIYLCDECHGLVHRLIKTTTTIGVNTWTGARRLKRLLKHGIYHGQPYYDDPIVRQWVNDKRKIEFAKRAEQSRRAKLRNK